MKRGFILLLLCVGFLPTALPAQQTVRYAIIPKNPRPGEPVTLAINIAAKQASLYVAGQRLARSVFFTVPAGNGQEFMAAILAVPSTARPGEAVIRAEDNGAIICEINFIIAQRTFVSEVIPLDPVLTGIRVDPDPQKTAESNQLWAILSRTGNTIYATEAFIPPVSSTRRTSFFGDRRVYAYSNGTSDTSIHAGIDYGVPTGTEVKACAAGRVVLARNRIVTGNSVVIEHLPGVYSLYYHMDKIFVTEGAVLDAGTVLGLSGSTGLATGPHLHWEIRVSGENTDPDAFISRPVLDKNGILRRITDTDLNTIQMQARAGNTDQ
jgi:murein DD-endopeptidase MepM/ murein hydrolase activator NlpD